MSPLRTPILYPHIRACDEALSFAVTKKSSILSNNVSPSCLFINTFPWLRLLLILVWATVDDTCWSNMFSLWHDSSTAYFDRLQTGQGEMQARDMTAQTGWTLNLDPVRVIQNDSEEIISAVGPSWKCKKKSWQHSFESLGMLRLWEVKCRLLLYMCLCACSRTD